MQNPPHPWRSIAVRDPVPVPSLGRAHRAGAVRRAGPLLPFQEGPGPGWSRARCRAARFLRLPPVPGSPYRQSRLLAPQEPSAAAGRDPEPRPFPGPDPAAHPSVPRRADTAARTRAGSFPTTPAGIYSFFGAGFRRRFIIFVSFPSRRSPTSPKRPYGAGSWVRRGWPGPGATPLHQHEGWQCPAGPSRSTGPRQGEILPFCSGSRSPRRSPGLWSYPSLPMRPPWLGSGSKRSKNPALGSAPRARRPRRAPDPNRRGRPKGRPRRPSSPRPRGDLHPVVPAGTGLDRAPRPRG